MWVEYALEVSKISDKVHVYGYPEEVIVENMTNEDGEDMGYYTSIITNDELLIEEIGIGLVNWKLCSDKEILDWMIEKWTLAEWKIEKIKEILDLKYIKT